MADEDFKRSTENLKKAVPLMMKNHVAATPANYALWYTYVDHSMPQLNIALDDVLKNYGVCPPATGTKLYNNYVARQVETDVSDLRANIELLVGEVSSSMTDTLADTSQFSATIDKSFRSLEQVQDESMSLSEVMDVVNQFVAESKDIRHSTKFLNRQLETASREIERLKSELASVQKNVLFDSLTNLYNRRSFDRDLKVLCESDQEMCLILVDIDHFKSYNDTYGHLFGDAVIKGIAKRILSSTRDGVCAYRFGGEEFALIVPNKPLRISRQFADGLRRNIEKITIKDKRTGKQVANISASFGVAELIKGEGPESLIERTDALLYEAKHLGRNRVMPV